MDTGSSGGKLVLLIGPSGVGKSVILQALRARHPEWCFPRSATTRLRRKGEGDDLYRFLSEEDFDRAVENEALLEWAVVHQGARYGTLVDEILPCIQQGKTVVREVDVQGFDSIRTHKFFRSADAPYVLQSIFILPESKEVLIQRIKNRAPISETELAHRIASMEQELIYADLCDVQIVNVEGKLENAVHAVESFVDGGSAVSS